MNESLRDLLMFIIRSGKFITVKDISKAYGISTRTVYNDLNAINQFLMDIKMKPLEKVKGMGVRYLLSRKEETALLKLLNDGDYVYLSSNERKYKVIITLLENDNYFTIDNLADLLQVSRNTAINDVSNARLWIEDFNLRLETFPFKGIFISGEEADIRRVLFKICFERERNLGYEDRVLYDILSEKEIKLLEGIIDVVENRLKLSFSDVSYSNIKLSFCIAIQRMKRKHYVSSYIESSKVEITKEYSVLYKMRNDITRLFNIEIPEEEIVYLSNQIISSCVQHLEITNFIFENWVHIQIVLRDFISAVEMELGVALKQDDKLFQGLQIHLRPAFYRLLNGTSIDNPILQQIKEQFGYIHKAVIRNLYILENNFNVTFTESEASFITMYFSGAVERLKKEPKKVLSVAIVCNSGISTSQMLLAQLKSRFEINIVGTFSARNIDSIIQKQLADLIITTIDLEEKEVKIVKVNPILSLEDIKKLNMILSQITLKSNAHTLIKIFKKYGVVRDEVGLRNELTSYLEPYDTNDYKHFERRIEPLLVEVLNEKLIEVNADIKNKEEAITKSGLILYENGIVEKSYIQAMLDNLKENGTYIVIAPGIAMPHARPELGAKKIGMSIITLKNPIVFGHPSNDPVRLVIGLSAVDSQTHLKALSELVDILEKEECVNSILAANSSKEVMEIIKRGGL